MKKLFMSLVIMGTFGLVQAETVKDWETKSEWNVTEDEIKVVVTQPSALSSKVAIPNAPYEISADMVVNSKNENQFFLAGIAIYSDEANFFQLILRDPANGQATARLTQKIEGQENSSNGIEKPQPAVVANWETNKKYKLSIKVTADKISGTVVAEDDTEIAKIEIVITDINTGKFSGNVGLRAAQGDVTFSNIELKQAE